MKKTIILLLLVIASSFTVSKKPYKLKSSKIVSTEYCNGWKDGYIRGYCYQEQYCITPIVPVCPIPNVGESYQSYRQGYDRGFVAGKKKANKD